MKVALRGLDVEDDEEARALANQLFGFLHGAGYDVVGVEPLTDAPEPGDPVPVGDLTDDIAGLGDMGVLHLKREGYETTADLATATEDDLLAVEQIGPTLASALLNPPTGCRTTEKDTEDGESEPDEGPDRDVASDGSGAPSIDAVDVSSPAPDGPTTDPSDTSTSRYLPDGYTREDVAAIARDVTYVREVGDELALDEAEARALLVNLDLYSRVSEGAAYGGVSPTDD